ncbi:DUF805 domain-containing protein [Alloalcanivorax marinus]|uniref:DUF805 domain-containing protein n=1 Tax=Alloalcanivorax marinus TaxID=1177169 RepID=UPI0019590B07|nr:DUF805 domain-containing protein [Alloalcanivorax marinus]MBM7335576.1 DUF805 domain-containing protein [Alloalcanivorax marinus]
MTEPYRSPTALDDPAPAHAATEPFAFRGRLGRLRYFAYLGLVTLVLYLLLTFASVLTAGASRSEPSALVGVVALLLMAVATFAACVYGIRRLNDLNRSGWLILLGFVPLVNLLLGLILLFVPGSPGDNRYGPRPPANGTGVILGAVAAGLVTLAMIGILAAVALPAYQDYVKRAEAYQMQLDNR